MARGRRSNPADRIERTPGNFSLKGDGEEGERLGRKFLRYSGLLKGGGGSWDCENSTAWLEVRVEVERNEACLSIRDLSALSRRTAAEPPQEAERNESSMEREEQTSEVVGGREQRSARHTLRRRVPAAARLPRPSLFFFWGLYPPECP